MRVIQDENELLNCFRDIDRSQVFLRKEVSFPLKVENYFAWVDPGGHRVYLVYPRSASEVPVGVVFRRGDAIPDASSKMCEWCHRVQAGQAVGLLSAHASENRTVGMYLCRDLSCKDKLIQQPGVHDMRETVGRQTKLDLLSSKIANFIKRHIV